MCERDQNTPLVVVKLKCAKTKGAVTGHIIQNIAIDEGKVEHLVSEAPPHLAVEQDFSDGKPSHVASRLVHW